MMSKADTSLRRPPDTATVEDLRGYQLHLVDHGIVTRFVERRDHRTEVLLRDHAPSARPDGADAAGARTPHATSRAQPGRGGPPDRGRRQPEAPDCPVGRLRRRAACGEVVALKVGDVDSQRMTLRIEQGKGRKRPLRDALAGPARTPACLVARQADPLPVEYYHVVFTVVFTLPAAISLIAWYNKAVIYGLLFDVAAETLRTIAVDPKHLGAQIGAALVLHTWGSGARH